jgi:hypothetical protein
MLHAFLNFALDGFTLQPLYPWEESLVSIDEETG